MEEKGNKASKNKSHLLEIWKDTVVLLRDTFLLLLVVLLLIFPTTLNGILVNAGFEEGSIVGFKWKAKLIESDQALKEAQASITDLSGQNEKLSQALAEAQARLGDPAHREKLLRLEEENKKLKDAVSKVGAEVQAAIVANADLVEKARLTESSYPRWGVVYGGDTNLEDARYEVGAVARKEGLKNTFIYLRQGSYRSVAVSDSRPEAEQNLYRAKNRRSDAYIVDLSRWCPKTVERSGYMECIR